MNIRKMTDEEAIALEDKLLAKIINPWFADHHDSDQCPMGDNCPMHVNALSRKIKIWDKLSNTYEAIRKKLKMQ